MKTEITIQLNGEAQMVPFGSTVFELLQFLEFAPQTVLLEYNGAAMKRSEWERIRFVEDDRVEILRVVAGG